MPTITFDFLVFVKTRVVSEALFPEEIFRKSWKRTIPNAASRFVFQFVRNNQRIFAFNYIFAFDLFREVKSASNSPIKNLPPFFLTAALVQHSCHISLPYSFFVTNNHQT
jgi:hypothetical protein